MLEASFRVFFEFHKKWGRLRPDAESERSVKFNRQGYYLGSTAAPNAPISQTPESTRRSMNACVLRRFEHWLKIVIPR